MQDRNKTTQNEVFQKMSADDRLDLVSGLWKLGQELSDKDQNYDKKSKKDSGRGGRNS